LAEEDARDASARAEAVNSAPQATAYTIPPVSREIQPANPYAAPAVSYEYNLTTCLDGRLAAFCDRARLTPGAARVREAESQAKPVAGARSGSAYSARAAPVPSSVRATAPPAAAPVYRHAPDPPAAPAAAFQPAAVHAYQPTWQPIPPPPVRYAPSCGENGSCYGDISTLTGRPKTSYVRGYTRRDGTYVRSHYRSRGRR
jgi:hypothetical protein